MDELRRVILAGGAPPGTPIPVGEIAELFGVSAIPVRESLKTLIGENLVAHRPNAGYTVAQLTRQELAEIYLVRGVLESAALRAAVEVAGPDDVQRATEAHLALERVLRDWDPRAYHREMLESFTARDATALLAWSNRHHQRLESVIAALPGPRARYITHDIGRQYSPPTVCCVVPSSVALGSSPNPPGPTEFFRVSPSGRRNCPAGPRFSLPHRASPGVKMTDSIVSRADVTDAQEHPAGIAIIKDNYDPRLTNEDLAPLADQHWTSYNVFAFWMSDVHSVGGYLTAGSLFALGLTSWQVLISLLVGIVIVQFFVNLVAKPSQVAGVPYPVIRC